jgi:uncharacterized protein YhdP
VLRRSSIIALEFLAALIAGLAILLGVLLWRISGDEPLRVAFLTPYLEKALTPADGRFTIDIEDTVLTWAGWERTLDLRARGVKAIAGDGQQIASVPQVSLTLSLRALLRGLVAPTAIEVFGPHVHLRRESNGQFAVAGIEPPEGGAPVDTGGSVFAAVMAELEDEPEPDSITGYLSRLSIVGGRLTLEDARLGLTWEAPEANVTVRRGPAGLTGDIALAVEKLGQPARFAARFDYDRATASIGIGGSFTGLDVPALGLLEPALMALEGVDLRLQGNFTTRIGLDGRIATTRFDLTGGPGQIAIQDRFDEPAPLQRLSLRGRVDAGGDTLVIESAVVDLGGPQLAAQLSVSGLISGETPKTGRMTVRGHLSAGNIAVSSLARYWPKGVASGARDWVLENITAGVADAGEVDFALHLLAGGDAVAVERIAGSFDASGVTLHYKKPLPPIENVAGHATFTDQEFAVDFQRGNTGNLVVQGGKTLITGLHLDDQIIAVDGVAAGPFADVLALLDHPPLGYAARLGFDPAGAAGTARAELTFRFPAKKGLAFEQVEMTVKGEVDGVVLAGAMFGRDVSSPLLTIDLDNDGMDVSGDVVLDGLPAAVQWRENFEGGEYQSRFVLDGRATAEQRATLGLDLRPQLDGPLAGQVVYTIFDDTRSVVEADLDLAAASLDLPELAWRKEAGTPGRALFALDLAGGQPAAIRDISVTAGDLTALGRARFAANGEDFAALDLDQLTFGKSHLTGVNMTFTPTRPEITIAGGEIDAEPWLESEDAAGQEAAAAATEGGAPPEEEAGEALLLTAARLDRVVLAEGREIANVSVLLDHDGSHWQRIIVDGTLKGGSPLAVRYQPEPNTGRLKFSVVAEDAGEALRTLDIVDNVVGGRLTIVGEAAADEPRRPLRGKAEISQFRLVRAPALARLLTLATLTGFVDVLTGDGLLFTRFTGDFVKTDGLLEVPLARAYGPSLGLTATGNINFDADTVDLKGTIAPAYILNSILGNIPLIGDLLQGGKGEGVFAATYSAKGSLQQPDITVNPIAALAPGFLRGLFDIFDGSGEASTPRALPEPGKDK